MSTDRINKIKNIGSRSVRISWAAVIAFPVYYAALTKTEEQPVMVKEEKQVSSKRVCKKYSDYCDVYYDWMPQATESQIMDAYNEYKESGLL